MEQDAKKVDLNLKLQYKYLEDIKTCTWGLIVKHSIMVAFEVWEDGRTKSHLNVKLSTSQ